jgi:chromosome segregation ATPase
MSNAHGVCQKKATEHFLKHCICDYDNSYKQQFLSEMQAAFGKLQSENIQVSELRCTELINRLYIPLTEKNYMRTGGYKLYQADIEQLKIMYDTEKHKGLMGNTKWSDFMAQETTVQTQILNADKSITEAEKALEREKHEREDAERRVQAAKEAEKKMGQALDDQDRCFRQEIERVRQQMEDDKKQREEEFQKEHAARQVEYERLVKEGLAEKAQLQMEAINMVKEEQARAASEAEQNRKMFEQMMQAQIEERRQEAAQMREELRKNMEQNRLLGEQINRMNAQRCQSRGRSDFCTIL